MGPLPAHKHETNTSIDGFNSMYAIVAHSGRQYKVEEGQELQIDYRDHTKGDTLTFDKILAVSIDGELKLGTPTVDGASVSAEVLGAEMGDKLFIQKLRRRKNSRRRTGHRQVYTRVRVDKINT